MGCAVGRAKEITVNTSRTPRDALRVMFRSRETSGDRPEQLIFSNAADS